MSHTMSVSPKMNEENVDWSLFSNFWMVATSWNVNTSWSSDLNSWSWNSFGLETRKVLAPKADHNVEIRQIDLGPEFIVYISASGKYSTPLTFGKWLTGTLDHDSGHLVGVFPYDLDRNPAEMGITIPIYRLVAHAFYGPSPDVIDIRHIDSDKTNNCVDNLAFY